jgi:putative FmdB family regulatory protein
LPTYQYSCTECGHFFEQFQSFSDPSLTTCPACEGRLRKVFNAVGVVFKGSGFYRNDSRTAPGSKDGAGSTAGATAASGTSGSGGTSSSGSDSGSSSSSSSGSSTSAKGSATTAGSAA